MLRETKLGIVVSCSFLGLLGAVVTSKLHEKETPPVESRVAVPDSRTATASSPPDKQPKSPSVNPGSAPKAPGFLSADVTAAPTVTPVEHREPASLTPPDRKPKAESTAPAPPLPPEDILSPAPSDAGLPAMERKEPAIEKKAGGETAPVVTETTIIHPEGKIEEVQVGPKPDALASEKKAGVPSLPEGGPIPLAAKEAGDPAKMGKDKEEKKKEPKPEVKPEGPPSSPPSGPPSGVPETVPMTSPLPAPSPAPAPSPSGLPEAVPMTTPAPAPSPSPATPLGGLPPVAPPAPPEAGPEKKGTVTIPSPASMNVKTPDTVAPPTAGLGDAGKLPAIEPPASPKEPLPPVTPVTTKEPIPALVPTPLPAVKEKTPEPAPAPAPAPAPMPAVVARTPAPPPGPGKPVLAESVSEEEYTVKQGDSFASISKAKYNAEGYAEALRRHNQADLLRSQPVEEKDGLLKAGQVVSIPDLGFLEQRYSNVLPKMPPLPKKAPETPPGAEGKLTPVPADVPDSAIRTVAASSGPKYLVPAGGQTMREVARITLGDGERWTQVLRLNPNFRPDYAVPAGTWLMLPPDAKVPNPQQ